MRSMSILNYIQYFINEGKHFRNILIYNSNISNVNEMDEIGKLCNSVTFSYDNNFLVSSYSIRLRFNRNIKIIQIFIINLRNFIIRILIKLVTPQVFVGLPDYHSAKKQQGNKVRECHKGI